MKTVAGLCLAVLLAACAAEPGGPDEREIPPGAWRVDYDRSRLGFSATQTGRTFEGEFERFDAIVFFDPDDLDSARIEVDVDMSSARTGDRQRDSALPTRDWFHIREHPTARFVAAEVASAGPGAYVARGQLDLRGVTQPVALDFTLETDGDAARAAGGTTLLRTDFGVGQGEFQTDEWIGLEVAVEFEIFAARRGESGVGARDGP